METWAVRPDGTNLRVVAAAADASYFPAAGPRRVGVKTRDLGDLHDEQLVFFESGGARPIGPAGSRLRNPSLAPDGRWAVFEADRDSFRDLYRVDVASGAVTRLTSNREGNFEPAVSPNGALIAFTSSRDGNAEIYVMPAAGGDARRLTAFHRQDFAPSWSPDGASLMFLSDREQVDRIFLMRPDGTGQRRLTDDLPAAGQEADPVWSPDSRWIAYVLRRPGTAELRVIPAGGGASLRVSEAQAGNIATPSWSPDGTHLAYTVGTGEETDLWTVAADGTGARRLTTTPGAEWLPRWVP